MLLEFLTSWVWSVLALLDGLPSLLQTWWGMSLSGFDFLIQDSPSFSDYRIAMTPSKLLGEVRASAAAVWENAYTGNQTILAGCVLVTLVRHWFDTGMQHDMISWASKTFNTLLVGTILAAAIHHMAAISEWTWSFTGIVMQTFTPSVGASAEPMDGLDVLWESFAQSGSVMWDLLWSRPSTDCGSLWSVVGNWGATWTWSKCKTADSISYLIEMANFVPGLIMIIIGAVLILIFFFNIMLQLLRGVINILVGLLLLPFTLAVWPIVDDWANKAIGRILGGVAQMAIVAFFASLISDVIQRLVAGMTEPKPYVSMGETIAAGGSFAIGATLVVVVMILLSATIHIAANAAMQIFGPLGSLKGLGGTGGMSGSGGKSGTPPKVGKGGGGDSAGKLAEAGKGAGGGGGAGAGGAATGAAAAGGAALAAAAVVAAGVKAAKAAEKSISDKA